MISTDYIHLLEVVQEAAALTDHLQEAPVGVLILGVGPHVLGEDVDALGENGDLDLGGAGVGLVGPVRVDNRGLFFFAKHSVFPPFQKFPAGLCSGPVKLLGTKLRGAPAAWPADFVTIS